MTKKLSDLCTERRSIVAQFVKWGNGEPIRLFSLTVIGPSRYGPWLDRTEYSVEWSKRYGYLYHHCGSGGGALVDVMGAYHVSGHVAVREQAATWCSARDRPPWRGKRTLKVRRRNRTRRLRQLPMCISGMKAGWDLLDWLEHNAIESEAVYCSVCDDWQHEDSWNQCDHVWWCDKSEWWSTPSERCECKDREECRD